jgi:hypothetical protein
MFGARVRRRVVAAAVVTVLGLVPLPPAALAEAASGPDALAAYLDGRPIKPVEVGGYYCDDFSYPVINCFSDPKRLETRVGSILAATAITYVVIYDYTGYAGAYMYVSEDYSILALIGWNDRVSSLRGVNSQFGQFFTDWFYGGTAWTFCCNSQYASLGNFDNSFSSVRRI